jgi:voltage-gated potassium channel Kch
MYIQAIPEVVGETYSDALFRFQHCALVGIRKADGTVDVMPDPSTRIESGDKLVLLAEDDSTVATGGPGKAAIDASCIVEREQTPPKPERTLILGWNRRGPIIVRELDNYVTVGSDLVIVASSDGLEEAVEALGTLENLTLTVQKGDTRDRRTLDALSIETFDHVITLSYSDDFDVQEADARSLITLLHARDIAQKTGAKTSIVSEMLDVKNRQLAEVTQADDFIVSDRLVGLMLSQLSEEKDLLPVFEELFKSEGAEIYLKPVEDYVVVGKPLNFYTVLESARRRGEVALGHRIIANALDAAAMYGVKVNPDKLVKTTYAAGDRIIVLAES